MSSPITVLLVDDDPQFTDLAAAHLDRIADRIVVSTDVHAADAIERVRSGEASFDCIVSDYEMPDVDGLELLERVRAADATLPFILFTGRGDEAVASRAIRAGVTDYIRKGGPDQFVVLANRIENAVAQFRAEKAAERSDRRLQELAEKSNDGLWMFAGDWDEMLFANSAIEDLVGLSLETMQAEPRRVLDVVHPDDRSDVTSAAERVADGHSADLEFRITETDRWVWFQAEPIFGADGQVARIVGFVRDVTERKARERALQSLNSVAMDLDALETVADICERSIAASEEILHFDTSVIDIEEDGELPKVAISSEIDPDNTATMSVEEGIAGKTYRTGESILIDDVESHPDANPQGPYRSAISVPIGGHGVFQAVSEQPAAFDEIDLELAELLASHTASALDRLDRERTLHQQNERLEGVTRIVSHDLRNPMNVLEASLELVAADCDSAHLGTATDALSRMESIVSDTLTLAREGAAATDTETRRLDSIVSTCWDAVATESADLEVRTERPVRADPGRLRHILENLFRNSVEHGSTSSQGGSRPDDSVEHASTSSRPQADDSLEHGSTSPDSQARQDSVEHGGPAVTVRVGDLDDGFYVEDDGPGVPESKRDEIFALEYSTAGSSGFGLSIVRQVADAHGWDVRVTDGPMGGARFEFTGVDP